MDIDKALELLQTPGTVLNCSSQEQVESFENETEVWLRLSATYEDGQSDKQEMRMGAFASLYKKQQFSKPKESDGEVVYKD